MNTYSTEPRAPADHAPASRAAVIQLTDGALLERSRVSIPQRLDAAFAISGDPVVGAGPVESQSLDHVFETFSGFDAEHGSDPDFFPGLLREPSSIHDERTPDVGAKTHPLGTARLRGASIAFFGAQCILWSAMYSSERSISARFPTRSGVKNIAHFRLYPVFR